MQDGIVRSVTSQIAVIACVGVIGLIGAGCNSISPVNGTTTSTSSVNTTTTHVPPSNYAFCNSSAKWVGDYSVNVEWALGLNDNRPLPIRMTPGIQSAVGALAKSSLALSKMAPTPRMATELRLLSVQLVESTLPIDVVRAEAAFGATGFPELNSTCGSSMMIMTPTNPLGGFNPG